MEYYEENFRRSQNCARIWSGDVTNIASWNSGKLFWSETRASSVVDNRPDLLEGGVEGKIEEGGKNGKIVWYLTSVSRGRNFSGQHQVSRLMRDQKDRGLQLAG